MSGSRFEIVYASLPQFEEGEISASLTEILAGQKKAIRLEDLISRVSAACVAFRQAAEQETLRRAEETAREMPSMREWKQEQQTARQAAREREQRAAAALATKAREMAARKIAAFPAHYQRHKAAYEREARLRTRIADYHTYPEFNRYE